MNIDRAIEWIESHIHYNTWAARSARSGDVELSLDRMRDFVELLGKPHDDFAIIHVTGTNGKGSTSRIITRLLMAAGLRVGTYSSPHLSAYNERFRIDDIDIDDDTLAALLTEMAACEHRFGGRLMPFELLTAAAYQWFADCAVDVAVVEVGVLGRFDATNVADGDVAVVTNIGFDHTNGEGDWALRIADEKAGIVKPGSHLILGAVESRLEHAFRVPRPRDVWRLGHEIVIDDDKALSVGRRLTVTTPLQTLSYLGLPLHGAHQAANCALAIAAASAFLRRPLLPAGVAVALAAVKMPGRLEIVMRGPHVILDGAHNPDVARALTRALHGIPCTGRRTLIVGLLGGRDAHTMLDELEAGHFDRVIACTPPTARARPAAEIASAATAFGVDAVAVDDIRDAMALALGAAAPDDQIVVTGSIYLVADARAWVVAESVTGGSAR